MVNEKGPLLFVMRRERRLVRLDISLGMSWRVWEKTEREVSAESWPI